MTGKASPGSGKISPRITSSSSPKATVEFFSNKIVASKITAKPEPKVAKETSRLSDIKEKDVKETNDEINIVKKMSNKNEEQVNKQEIKPIIVEIGTAKEYKNACPKQVVIKSPKHTKSNVNNTQKLANDISNQAKSTIAQLDAMENEFLCKRLTENGAKNNNIINKDLEKEILINLQASEKRNINIGIEKINVERDKILTESPTKSEDNFADISNESSPKFDIEKTQGKNVESSDRTSEENEISVDDYSSQNGSANYNNVGNERNEVALTKTDTSELILNKNSNVNDLTVDLNLNELTIKKPNVKNCDGPEQQTEVFQEKLKTANDHFKIGNNNDISATKDIPQQTAPDSEKSLAIKNSNEFTKEEACDSEFMKGEILIISREKEKQFKENATDTLDSTEKSLDNDFVVNSNNFALDKDLNVTNDLEREKIVTLTCKQATKEVSAVDDTKKEHDKKKLDKQNLETKQTAKPAYSQAAAKPKTSNQPAKMEVKTPTRLARSSTVVELRPATVPKTQRSFQKKNQTNKCSYPFNLTTGRSSLFDGTPCPSKGAIPKRPINRNSQMTSGDTKSTTNKEVVKKRPPRPYSLKLNETVDRKEKCSTLQKNKDEKNYSSTDTVVPRADMPRIESSESIKTLVPEDHHNLFDVANSIEVLNVDHNKNDEGWLTVKSRRLSRESKKHSKSHWTNRFHQPSATTSLPTLNMLESPKQETKNIVVSKETKGDRAKSEQPQKFDKQLEKSDKVQPDKIVPYEMLVDNETVIRDENISTKSNPDTNEKMTQYKKPTSVNNLGKTTKSEKAVKVSAKFKSETKARDPSMIRQKSDVTGLRTKSSRNKVLTKRAEKVKDCHKYDDTSDLTKNRLHSSLESLTTALARSQESTEDAFDFDKWKAEFKSTFKYLEDDDQMSDQNEILKGADPSEMSEIAEMTSQIEENERIISWALDFQSEVDQRKLCEEEDLLNRQILELQNVSDIEIDTETDDTEVSFKLL